MSTAPARAYASRCSTLCIWAGTRSAPRAAVPGPRCLRGPGAAPQAGIAVCSWQREVMPSFGKIGTVRRRLSGGESRAARRSRGWTAPRWPSARSAAPAASAGPTAPAPGGRSTSLKPAVRARHVGGVASFLQLRTGFHGPPLTPRPAAVGARGRRGERGHNVRTDGAGQRLAQTASAPLCRGEARNWWLTWAAIFRAVCRVPCAGRG